MQTFDKGWVDQKPACYGSNRRVFQESANRAQPIGSRAGRSRLGRCASQDGPMCLGRAAEELIGFPLATARPSEKPGNQPVPLRHRWARRCCRVTNDRSQTTRLPHERVAIAT